MIIFFPLLLLLSVCYSEEYQSRKFSSALSITKGGNIRIGECNAKEELFQSPYFSDWSCEDATTYTWRHDFDRELRGIALSDRERLTASAGYCPHRRCQLGNASASGSSELCPPGLCFTKIENGRPSFGACCFTGGFFETSKLLGYFNRSQPTPKPIYKNNRIVLGGISSDISEGSFINANEVSPGVIAAQCPMTAYPDGFANTIEDMKRMLIEQDVKIWVQLSPSSQNGELMTAKDDGSTKSYCEVFPLRYWGNASHSIRYDSKHREGVSNFRSVQNKEQGYFNLTYTLTAFVRRSQEGGAFKETIFDVIQLIDRLRSHDKVCELCSIRMLYQSNNNGMNELGNLDHIPYVDDIDFYCSSCDSSVSFGWEIKKLDVEHLWFYKWNDFEVPSSNYMGVVSRLADRTAVFISKGYRSAITCYSGRGRTGTFSAIVLAKLKFTKADMESDLRITTSDKNGNTTDTSISATVVDTDGSVIASGNSLSVTELVDIIVDMRRSRDGLVESPTQLKFVLDVLNMRR